MGPTENVVKRVAAVGGETVALHGRGSRASAGAAAVTVPPGHVWLMGDNAPASRDSREYGAVPLGLLRGRVVAQLWPRPRWGCDGGGGAAQ